MTDKQTEALKLALEALEVVTKELLAVRDELAERGGRPKTNIFHQKLWDSSHVAYIDKAIPAAIAIREALAEPDYRALYEKAAQQYNELAALIEQPAQKQEPVAWLVCSVNNDGSLSLEHAAAWEEAAHEHINDAITEHDIKDAATWVVRPAYTSPPASKPLTDEEIEELFADGLGFEHHTKIVREIEAAHGIK